MTLDLMITHWTEPWEVGKNALTMLSLQRGVDWKEIRVTIVHDGSKQFPAEYFAGFPFEMHQVELTHRGIAAVRNWCIDNSDAEWIKWCDFDDTFVGIYSLKTIMDGIRLAKKMDMLWFDLLWELDGRILLRTERNPVFIHDKVFRRRFLNDTGSGFRRI